MKSRDTRHELVMPSGNKGEATPALTTRGQRSIYYSSQRGVFDVRTSARRQSAAWLPPERQPEVNSVQRI